MLTDVTSSEDLSRAHDRAVSAVKAEALMVLLPLLTVCLVFFAQGRTLDVYREAEWSFAATILFGQTIVKVVAFSAASLQGPKWQKVSLTVTMIIVLGLVPSTLFLCMLLMQLELPSYVYLLQIPLAVGAVVTFRLVAAPAQIGVDEPHILENLLDRLEEEQESSAD